MDALQLARDVFGRFDEIGVRYCHFKSNMRLEDAVSGRTDLDLLFLPDDREKIESTFRTFDVKRITSRWDGRYPGLDDYLGFDHASGGLLHFHVHYRLIIGRKYSKSFHLPVEEEFLARARSIDGFRAPSPEDELILLALRANTKLSTGTLLRRIRVRDGSLLYPREIRREFGWLLEQCGLAEVSKRLEAYPLDLAPEALAAFLHDLTRSRLSVRQLRRFRSQVFAALGPHRWMAPSEALTRSLAGRFLRNRFVKKRLRHRKKRFDRPGRVIALVGADGSGKSTLAKDLYEWLGWKLSARRVYLGLPRDAPLVRALKWLETRWGRGLRNGLRDRLIGTRWLAVARERSRKLKRARVWASRGELVISDRFPMREFWSMPEPMDGPRCRARGLPALADREEAIYLALGEPDLVFLLQAPLEVLRRRESGPPREVHERKASAVRGVATGPSRIAVDVDRPYDEVLLEIQREIWSAL